MIRTQSASGRPVINTTRRHCGGRIARDATAVAAAVAVVLGVVPAAVAHHEKQLAHPQLAQAAGDPPALSVDALIGKWDVRGNGCTDTFDEYRADGTRRIAYRTGDRWELSALRPVGRYSLDGDLLTITTERPDGAVVETVAQTIRLGLGGQLMRRDRSRLRTDSETGKTIALETRFDSVVRCPEAATAGADEQLDRSLAALEQQVAAAPAFAADHPKAAALRGQILKLLKSIPNVMTGWYGFDEVAGYMLPLAETETGYRLVLPALEVAGKDGEKRVEIGTISIDFAPRADGRLDMAVALPAEIFIGTDDPRDPERIGILLGETDISGVWDPDFEIFFDLDARLGAVGVAMNGQPVARLGTVTLITDSDMTADDRMTSASELSIADFDVMGTLLIDRIALRAGVEDFVPSVFFQGRKAVMAEMEHGDLQDIMADMQTADSRRVLADTLDALTGSFGLWQSDLSIDGIWITPRAAMAGPAAGWSIGSITMAFGTESAADDEFGALDRWVFRFGTDAIRAAPQSLPPTLAGLVPRRLGFSIALENLPARSLTDMMVETLRRDPGDHPAAGQMALIQSTTMLFLQARSAVRLGDVVLEAPDAGIEGEAVVGLDPDNPKMGGGSMDLEIRGLDTMTETARAMGASKEELAALGLLTAFGLPIENRSGDYRYVVTLDGLHSILVNDRDISPLMTALQDM